MINSNKPYFIAETAFHHEGNVDFLRTLVKDISNLNVDSIKFHLLFDLNDYIIEKHQAKEVLQSISIKKEDWIKILTDVKEYGKNIILLANDVESLKWAISIQNDYPIAAIELHSTGLNDLFLLQECVKFNRTIMLGVGGSTFDEVLFAIEFLEKNGKNDILLMHGFQNYPTNFEDINLKRMDFYKEAFGYPVGYADHTDPNNKLNSLISCLPQVMGHNILEKHVTNSFGTKRIDAQAAVSLEQMKEIIEYAKASYSSLGNRNLIFSESEKKYGNTGPMKKALVAKIDLNEGEILSFDKIAYKRTEQSTSLNQKDIMKLINSRVIKNIKKDEILSFSNIEYHFKENDFNQFFVTEE